MTRGEDNSSSRTLAAPLDPNFWDGEVISYSSSYRIIMIIINNFLLCCFVSCVVEPHTGFNSPVQFLPTSRCERVMFSPLVRECHSHICLQPQPSRKVKCWHFDRSFDSIFYIYIKCRCGKPFRSQRWPACCVSRPSGMWAEPPLNAARRKKPNVWRSCSSVFKQQWGRAGR